jgi:hypothetical protein
MSLIYPQKKKSMGVKSGLCEGQLIGLPLLIDQPGNGSSRELCTVAQIGLVHHLVGE